MHHGPAEEGSKRTLCTVHATGLVLAADHPLLESLPSATTNAVMVAAVVASVQITCAGPCRLTYY